MISFCLSLNKPHQLEEASQYSSVKKIGILEMMKYSMSLPCLKSTNLLQLYLEWYSNP